MTPGSQEQSSPARGCIRTRPHPWGYVAGIQFSFSSAGRKKSLVVVVATICEELSAAILQEQNIHSVTGKSIILTRTHTYMTSLTPAFFYFLR